eukprot:14461362-Ditylum_brightwellii.AAC.1
MANVTLNTLSQSSNIDERKTNKEQQSNDEEEDSSKDELSSSSMEDENPITQDEEFKKPMKPMLSINVMTRKQMLLALRSTPPHNLGEIKQQK